MELFGSREDYVRLHQEMQPLEGYDDSESGDLEDLTGSVEET